MTTNTQELLERLITYCYRLLARRPYSEQEVRTKLEQYGYKRELPVTLEIVESVLTLLRENKYIDDTAFANWFVEQRQQFKPKSKRVIALELKQKGISEEISIQALSTYSEDQAVALLVGKKKGYTKEKMISYLLNRGFPYDIVSKRVEV